MGVAYTERFLRALELSLGMIALMAGGLIYIVYRGDSLLMFRWFNELGLLTFIENLKFEYGQQNLYGWIKYNMPAGLWVFSYLFVIDSIWWKEKGIIYKVFIYVLPTISIGSEFMQYLGIIPGTFDALDVCSYFFAVLLFLLIKTM